MPPTDESPLPYLLSKSVSYAGIGSRSTPPGVLTLMGGIALILTEFDLILRSGGAPGADSAFERACDRGHGRKEIFLPWKTFNGSRSCLCTPPIQAEVMASEFHPNWTACTPAARKLHARNCQQITGRHLDDPVDFVLFWAPEKDGKVQGGTATAVHLARKLQIPTFNLRCPTAFHGWSAFAKAHIRKNWTVKSHLFDSLKRTDHDLPTS